MDAKFGHDLLNNRAAKFSQVHINNLAGFALFNTYYLDRKNETDGKYYINRMVDRRGRKLTSIYRPIFGLEGSKNIETINPPLLR